MRLISAICTFLLALPLSLHAAPVSVSQQLSFATVAPFGTFSEGTYVLPDWSLAFPFTSASQITGITFQFATSDADFTNPALFPGNDNGGIPGLEIGVKREDNAARLALASVTASAASLALNLATPEGALVRDWLLDGGLTVSIGAFVNFANAVGGAFSDAMTLDQSSTLLLTLSGDVPVTTGVPEPQSLALVLLALGATVALRRRVRGTAQRA